MGGVTKGEATLNTGMALVGFAVFPGGHVNHGVAAHLSLKGTAHAAIGAGGNNAVLGLAEFNNGVFGQGGRRASADTGAARDAVRIHKAFFLTGADG